MNVNEMADEIFGEVMSQQKGHRGKKQCPDCSAFVGVRTYRCECGYQFVEKKTKAEKRQEEDAATEEERLYAMCIGANGGRLVYAASGSPSARLADITYEAVVDYCEMIVYEGKQDCQIILPQAIKNYIQHQFGYNSEEYISACELVDQWYDEKLGIDTPSGEQ
jgi:hypothetical protein